MEPVYLNGVFAGYGLVSRPLDTADDKNRYAAGAKMALYDAIEIKENGDSGDYGYDGVEVTRDRNNNVQSINVKKGYSGSTVEFINKKIRLEVYPEEPGKVPGRMRPLTGRIPTFFFIHWQILRSQRSEQMDPFTVMTETAIKYL